MIRAGRRVHLDVSHVDITSGTAATSVRHWPGMRSEYGWYPPSGDVTVTKPQQVGVSFAEHHGVVADRDGRGERIDIRSGDVFANGRTPIYWSDVTEPDEVVEIYLTDSLLRETAGTTSPPEIAPRTGARDPVVLGTATILKRAHVSDEYVDDVRATTMARRLAEHLIEHYCGIRLRRGPARGLLDPVQLTRVGELVEQRLSDSLTVDDLAAAASLSPFHFARAFKASTGLAPYEFVTSRRMERAKSMLLSSRLSVPEVAYAVGFANLSHFRRTFRRHSGFMPSDLRAR